MAKTKNEQGFEILPLMPLRGMILFPHATMDLDVGREQSIKAVEKAMESDQRIFVVPQKNMNVEDPKQGDMNPVGTIARIRQVLHITGSMLRVLVEGEQRAELQKTAVSQEAWVAWVKPVAPWHRRISRRNWRPPCAWRRSISRSSPNPASVCPLRRSAPSVKSQTPMSWWM